MAIIIRSYDIDIQKGRKGFTRWRVVEFRQFQGRFLTRREASHRAQMLNDENAETPPQRDRIGARFRKGAWLT